MATALSPEDVESRLRARFGQDVLAFEEQHGHAVATVGVDRYREVCRFLRDEPEFACDYCDFTGWILGSGVFSVIRPTARPPCARRRGDRWPGSR